MADDIRITMTGDSGDLKRELRKFEGIVNRFDKVNKKSSKRREKQSQKTSKKIERITASEVRHTMQIRRRMNRLVERDRKQREREAIRSEKRIARERERILRKHAARRRRLMRGIGRGVRGGLGLLGIGGGIGVIYKAREILKFDEALARTAVQAKVTVAQQMELRESINKTSLEFGTQRDVILETVKAIIDKLGGGGWNLVTNNLDKFAMIIRGMGTDPRELGLAVSALKEALVGVNDADLFKFLEIIIAQGDAAKVNLAELASEGGELFSAFLGAGFEGKKAFTEYGAFIQMAAKSAGSVSEASTAVTRFVTTLIKDWEKLEEAGVKIYEKSGGIRDIGDILRDLFEVTGGDMREITELIPNIRAFKGLQFMAGEYRKLNGELKTFNDLYQVGIDASDEVERKFRRVAETASQGFERMAAGLTLFSDKALVGVLNDMADSMGRFLDDPQALKQLEQTAKELGIMFKFAWKLASIGGKGIKLAGLGDIQRLEVIKSRLKALPEEKRREAKLPLWRTMLPGFMGAAEKRLKEIEFNVENNITIDETGSQLHSESILKYQQNEDRGEYVTRQGAK